MKVWVIFLLVFVAGCVSTIVYSSKGEELYNEKCGGCHKLHSVNEYSNEKWKIEMEIMSRKAKLNENEKRIIINYLIDANGQSKSTK